MSTFAKRSWGNSKSRTSISSTVCPVVSIDQKQSAQPRSTVGTMTDISDYLQCYSPPWGCPTAPVRRSRLHPYQMMEHLCCRRHGSRSAPVYKIYGEDYEYLSTNRVNATGRRIDGKPRPGDHIELDEDEAYGEARSIRSSSPPASINKSSRRWSTA
jgi:hypothetical protein